MIDTTTIRRTPARSPAACRLRAEVVKNSVAARSSGEGPVATSTTTSTPASASSRPAPVITSTPRVRAVAYKMLGSLSEADDAVQESWLRLSRSDISEVENLRAWLTTVVARVSLNVLRSRRTRREEPLDVRVPDPVVAREDGTQPEHEALLADSVGLALLVVLDTLGPAERLAFVLHDMFGVPFDEIAGLVDRSPAATRQLASRARRRVQGAAPVPDADLAAQRRVVDAFFAAARDGDFDALVAVLDPDVVLRSDGGTLRPEA